MHFTLLQNGFKKKKATRMLGRFDKKLFLAKQIFKQILGKNMGQDLNESTTK